MKTTIATIAAVIVVLAAISPAPVAAQNATNTTSNSSSNSTNSSTPCTVVGDCHDRATSVTGNRPNCQCACRNKWTGAKCESCPLNFNMSAGCASCMTGFVNYPQCTAAANQTNSTGPCTAAHDCNGHAAAVSGNRPNCSCVCRNKWMGARCDMCPAGVDALNDCGVCKAGYTGYPNCHLASNTTGNQTNTSSTPCSIVSDCHDRAAAVSGNRPNCSCVCRNKWMGARCDMCPAGVDAARDCGVCKDGYTGYPNCQMSPTTLPPCATMNMTTCEMAYKHCMPIMKGTNFWCVRKGCSELMMDECHMYKYCHWIAGNTSKCIPKKCSYLNQTDCDSKAGCAFHTATAGTTGGGMCKHITCSLYNNESQYCPRTRCSFDSTTNLCERRPCNAYSSYPDACNLLDGCTYDQTKKCINKPCNWYQTSDSCGAHCWWNSAVAKCEFKSCAMSYNANDCWSNPNCYWNATVNKCWNMPCMGLSGQHACAAADKCWWNANTTACITKPCLAFRDSASCGAQLGRCFWDNDGQKCAIMPCSMVTTQQWCDPEGCWWNKTTSKCHEIPCFLYDKASTCQYGRCWWDWRNSKCVQPACASHSNLTCPVGKCWFQRETNKCVPVPCQIHNSSTICKMSDCHWDARSTSCVTVPCQFFTVEGVCSSDRCWWNETGKVCRDAPCGVYKESQACNYPRCWWDSNTSTCISPPCYTYKDKDMCPQSRCYWETPKADEAGATPKPGRCAAIPCAAYSTKNLCPWGRCYWMGSTESCIDPPCEVYTTGGLCPLDRCVWYREKCVAPNCNVYAEKMTCPARCWWNDKMAKCEMPYCGLFSNTTRCPLDRCWMDTSKRGLPCIERPCHTFSSLESCASVQACWWDRQSMKCATRRCSTFFSAESCPMPNCWWHNASRSCISPECEHYDNADLCPSSRCWWNHNSKECTTIACKYFPTEGSCAVDRCYWAMSRVADSTSSTSGDNQQSSTTTAYTCKPIPCAAFDQQSVCRSNLACVWIDPTSADGTQTWTVAPSSSTDGVRNANNTIETMAPRSGYCAAKEVDLPCSETPKESCLLPRCYYNYLTASCQDKPCRILDRSECKGRCAWNVGNSSLCSEIPCRFFGSDVCESTYGSRCSWSNDTMQCHAKHCMELNRAECDPRRCWFDADNKVCKPRYCDMAKTQSACPTETGECAWWNGICITTDCEPRNTSAKCLRNERCTFLAGTPGTNEQPMCAPKSIFTHAPCTTLYRKDGCEAAANPAGRCAWDATTNRCGYNQATILTLEPCFRSKDESSCPKTYCKWAFGALCINPQCENFGTDMTKCKAANCVFSTALETCTDPQRLLFPCMSFPNKEVCPKGRCAWNGTSCTAFTFTADVTRSGATAAAGAEVEEEGPVDETVKTCRMAQGEADCLGQRVLCRFNTTLKKCDAPPCSAYGSDCPTQRCRAVNGKCHEMCPSAMVFCPSTFRCSATREGCARCPSTDYQCWDSTCVKDATRCSCNPAQPFRCPSSATGQIGKCVSNLTLCASFCHDKALPFKCWDGSCAKNRETCPCPDGAPFRCSDNVTCVAHASRCSDKCADGMARCPSNGECVSSKLACPCGPNAPIRCPYDGQCYPHAANCSCPSGQVQCPGSVKCAKTEALCTVQCQGTTPVKCPDGTCKESRADCGACPELDFALPEVDIKATDATFDVTRWYHIGADVNLTVCGRNLQQEVRVEWYAFDLATGARVKPNDGGETNAVSLFKGRVVTIKPNTFEAGRTFVVTAIAFAPNGLNASAQVVLTTVAPTPKVSMLGGNRTVSNQGLTLATYIEDRGTPADVAWWCCTGTAEACYDSCGAVLDDALGAATTRYLYINATIPAGTYLITAYYKGIAVSANITVKGEAVPRAQIINVREPTLYNDFLTIYAIAKYPQRYTTSWWVMDHTAGEKMELTAFRDRHYLRMNASLLTDTVFVPGRVYTFTFKVADAANANNFATTSTRYLRAKPVTGECWVKIATAGATQAVALDTELAVTSKWWNTNGRGLRYMFAIRGKNQNGEEVNRPIVPFTTEVTEMTMLAPMLPKNPASGKLWIAVIARDADTERFVAAATCGITIYQDTRDPSAIVAAQFEALKSAQNVSDAKAVLQSAKAMTSALQLNGVNRTEIKQKIASAVKSSVKTGEEAKAMSQSERSAAVQSLDAMIEADEEAEETGGASKAEAENKPIRDDVADTILDVIEAVVSKTDAQNTIAESDGAAALRILAKIRASKRVQAILEKLAKRIASQGEFGVKKVLQSGNVTIASINRAGNDLANATIGPNNGTFMRLPDDFEISDANETSQASLVANSYAAGSNPFSATGLDQKERLVADVADYGLEIDGETKPVMNLKKKILLTFWLNNTKASNATKRIIRCLFYDRVKAMWTNESIETVSYDPATGLLKCLTPHLSPYSAGESEESSAVAETTAAPEGSSPTTTAAVTTTTTAAPPTTPLPSGHTHEPTTEAPSTAVPTTAVPTTPLPSGHTYEPTTASPPTTAAPAGASGSTASPSGSTASPSGSTASPSGSVSTPTTTAVPPTTPLPAGHTYPPPTTGNAGGAAADEGMDSNTKAAVIGGSIAGVFILCAALFFIIKAAKGSKGTGQRDEDSQPLNEINHSSPLTNMESMMDGQGRPAPRRNPYEEEL